MFRSPQHPAVEAATQEGLGGNSTGMYMAMYWDHYCSLCLVLYWGWVYCTHPVFAFKHACISVLFIRHVLQPLIHAGCVVYATV